MSKQMAIKLKVEIGSDHMVHLPDEVPVGPAELIVLVDEKEPGERALSALGLFHDEPEVVDEALAYAREMRSRLRLRQIP